MDLKAIKNKDFTVISEDLIKETALRTLDIESQSIIGLKQHIGQGFVECVRAIAQSQGRLVVTGIGKSAIIAQKIVATLNSTGTPSLFMHAADAIHGDLGMVRPVDLVLCLSKSGESPEIKVLVPLVKHLGSALIGMVANPSSFLAQHADYVLHTPIEKEADPNNLAPTASTTVQVAMGDALATALLRVKGFSPADFAQYHPGGALGKQLYLRVLNVYPQNERPTTQQTDSVEAAILEMTSKRLGCTVVVDELDRVLGIITDGDLRRMLERKADLNRLKAADLMTPKPQTVEKEALAVKALEVMRQKSITQLIVTDAGKYAGIIHLHDLIREGLI